VSSWHQDRNPGGLRALWTPHPTKWKCVSDRAGQLASCMSFDDEAEARAYAAKTGGILIPPQPEAK
jgi:hypothetical protein